MTALAKSANADSAYKVVELSEVTDREIETALNRWTSEGYRFESIHFATQPGSRRPAMAFLFFMRVPPQGKE